MPELPARIRVGPFVYTVETRHEQLRGAERSASSALHGSTEHRELRMLLDTSTPLAQQQDTLWHEVKHCVNYLAAFGGRDKLGEEDVVTRTASLELMVLRDNPTVVAFLLAEESA